MEKIKRAKIIIAQDFMNQYNEWRRDITNLNDLDFSIKHGGKVIRESAKAKYTKNNITTITFFWDAFLQVKTLEMFRELDIDKETVWHLSREHWLNRFEDHYHSRVPTTYCISLDRAKAVWRWANNA